MRLQKYLNNYLFNNSILLLCNNLRITNGHRPIFV